MRDRSCGVERRLRELSRTLAGPSGDRKQEVLRLTGEARRLLERCERVAGQIRARLWGEPITDRLVSLADPDARPIRKGRQGKPREVGYVVQITEVTPNTTGLGRRDVTIVVHRLASAPTRPD